MKKSTGVILVLIIVLLLGVIGVGGYFLIKGNNDSNKEIGELKNEVANLNKGVQNQTSQTNISFVNNNEESQENFANESSSNSTSLTAEELKEIENYLNIAENNGFVAHNLYKNIDELNIGLVFYSSTTEQESQAEIDELLNGEEQFTDIAKVTTARIKKVIYEKTGKSLTDEEIKNRMNWKYLSNYDAFYHQHGDTSRMDVKCESGYKTADGTYKVILSNAVVYDRYDGGNSRKVKNTLVTLKKEGNSYKFISHVINTYAD